MSFVLASLRVLHVDPLLATVTCEGGGSVLRKRGSGCVLVLVLQDGAEGAVAGEGVWLVVLPASPDHV
jgi:hypothetical protein